MKTIETILKKQFEDIPDRILESLESQVDAELGTRGGKALGRAILENLDDVCEAPRVPREMRVVLVDGLITNVQGVLTTIQEELEGYGGLQMEVVDAKAANNPERLAKARLARDAASKKIKELFAGISRASAGGG